MVIKGGEVKRAEIRGRDQGPETEGLCVREASNPGPDVSLTLIYGRWYNVESFVDIGQRLVRSRKSSFATVVKFFNVIDFAFNSSLDLNT